ncbi:MAG: AAA family ATPase [Defluviicoccus sp.]
MAAAREAILNAPVFEPADDDGPRHGGNGAGGPGDGAAAASIFEPEDAADMLAEVIPPRQWLLGTALCRDFVTVLAAKGGSGKTSLMLAWVLSLATGRALVGSYIHKRARVLILTGEDTRAELLRRLRATCIHYSIDDEQLRGWLYVRSLNGVGVTLATVGADGTMADTGAAKQILDVIARLQIDVVAFDPFIKLSGAPENDNMATDFVCRLLSRIAETGNVAVLVAHHYRKGPNEAGNIDGARGARSLIDAARIAYTLQPMNGEEAQSMSVPEAERWRLVRLDDGKLNLTVASKARWFRMASVDIGNGDHEYPNGDNVQAIETWTPPDTFAGLDTAALNRILDAIEAGPSEGERYSGANAAKDRAAWRAVQTIATDKTEEQCRAIIAAWKRSGLLKVVEYESTADRKPCKGLSVDASKRPGNVYE